jgi:transcriptional regulator with XRE-family HTH domain
MVGSAPVADPWIRRYLGDVLKKIRDRRMSLGLTQKQVAERLDWGRTTIVAIESGRQALTVEQLVHLACALRADPWSFLPFAFFNADERRAASKAEQTPYRRRPRRRAASKPPGLSD